MDTANVLVHVRFAPNGTVVEIGERPTGPTPQEWFDFLAERLETAYQTFSGGRGVFRVSREQIDKLKAERSPTAA